MVESKDEPRAVMQHSGPLVSIVMPTFNRQDMVAQAIEAVLAQSHKDLELIIVNDGSQDNTRRVLDAYVQSDSRVRAIHKDNQGIPDTVNRGWREARGKYVTWTSDDNLYHSTAIEMMVQHLEAHPEVVMVYTDHRDIDGAGNVISYPPGREPEALETDCVIYGSVLFRRSVFNELDMFRREWTRCHDYEFYRRVYKRFKVERIPVVLYDYRRHAASMTGNHYAITTEHARLLSAVAESRSLVRFAWARCWYEIARQSEREGLLWRAVWYHGKAALWEPSRRSGLWRSLKAALYSMTPGAVRSVWRALKRPEAESGT